jgi:integrase
VLTDAELAAYLCWQHPDPRHAHAVLQRQVMSVVSRCFGGVRTGDLHAMRWEQLDTQGGAFEFGTAPRKKTERPQRLAIPEMLRPFLRDWWHRAGRPSVGLVFPTLRAAGAPRAKRGVSHAAALRRDLQRSFEAARAADPRCTLPARGSARWRELFAATELTKPVDFHSFRRAFAQALAGAGVSAQTAIALTGHSDMTVHARYLQNTAAAQTVPSAALPQLRLLPAQSATLSVDASGCN